MSEVPVLWPLFVAIAGGCREYIRNMKGNIGSCDVLLIILLERAEDRG